MKKALMIIGSIIVVFAIIITCVGFYFIQTPEYALMKISKDIKESGIDGLRPHLTEDAQETFDTVSAIADNKLVSSIMGLFDKNDYISILKSEIKTVQWNVEDIMKSSDNATVILAFNYDDHLIGTIEISMVRSEDGWKIDGLELPKFDKIDW